MNKRGLRITIDGGLKGSGRTYLAEKVSDFLRFLKYDAIIVNESISSPAGIEEVSKLHDVTIIERENL